MLQTAPDTHQLPAVRTTMYAAVGSRDLGNTFNAKGSRTATKSDKETGQSRSPNVLSSTLTGGGLCIRCRFVVKKSAADHTRTKSTDSGLVV